MSRRHVARPPARGYALVTALVFLLLLSGIALGMLRKAGFQARIAGHVLDKARAQQLAEAALLYGERLLEQQGAVSAAPCHGVLQAATLARVPVCDAPLADPATLPWPDRVDYLPGDVAVTPPNPGPGAPTSTGMSEDGLRMAASPAFHIAWLGYSGNSDRLFLVTAAGYGGRASSVSVVRSVYVLSTDTRCGDCP